MSGTTKEQDADDDSRANDNENGPGEAVAGAPGQEGDCTHVYESRSHKVTEEHRQTTEQSPSAGWRAVYDAMEVGDDAHGQW